MIGINNQHWQVIGKHITKNVIDEILILRNVGNKHAFLYPSLSHLSDPFDMFGTLEFVKYIDYLTKNKQKKIFIHGDFDVDGISATALLWRFLSKELNLDAIPIIPNRFQDGYGISENTIKKILDLGGNVLISVDCGIKDIDIINKYSHQIDFIVTDHHTPLEGNTNTEVSSKDNTIQINKFILPKGAKIIVHPMLSEKNTNIEICGSMVVFKLCMAMNEFFKLNANLEEYSVYPCLGTICDVMPLTQENRIIVKIGIDQLRTGKHIGIQSLARKAKINIKNINAYHLGFIIGPRLNASGRIESATDALRLLCTNSKEYADLIAEKLEDLNKTRQNLTNTYLQLAENYVLNQELYKNKIIIILGEKWPEGIIGLLASKLSEKYERPVIVGSIIEDIIKASARSNLNNLHITKEISKISNLLIKHGGHEKAAGLTLKTENKELFIRKLTEMFNYTLVLPDQNTQKLIIDASISINIDTISELYNIELLEPFGYQNPEPIFLIEKNKINTVTYYGKNKNHTKLNISPNDYMYSIDSILFNARLDNYMNIQDTTSKYIDIVGKFRIQKYNDDAFKPEINILDLRLH
ncbi:MAG: DHHA1 domain-containing protein [Candidatus Dojkabacteria bacterium]|nr:DHHA1 domain-containing protein [Candidatus Dojkabacteria bacterium]